MAHGDSSGISRKDFRANTYNIGIADWAGSVMIPQPFAFPKKNEINYLGTAPVEATLIN